MKILILFLTIICGCLVAAIRWTYILIAKVYPKKFKPTMLFTEELLKRKHVQEIRKETDRSWTMGSLFLILFFGLGLLSIVSIDLVKIWNDTAIKDTGVIVEKSEMEGKEGSTKLVVHGEKYKYTHEGSNITKHNIGDNVNVYYLENVRLRFVGTDQEWQKIKAGITGYVLFIVLILVIEAAYYTRKYFKKRKLEMETAPGKADGIIH